MLQKSATSLTTKNARSVYLTAVLKPLRSVLMLAIPACIPFIAFLTVPLAKLWFGIATLLLLACLLLVAWRIKRSDEQDQYERESLLADTERDEEMIERIKHLDMKIVGWQQDLQRTDEHLRNLQQDLVQTDLRLQRLTRQFIHSDDRLAQLEEQEREKPASRQIFPVADGGKLPYGWQVVGASVRGHSHARAQQYREDAFHIHLFPHATQLLVEGMVIVAIADGVGSCKFSRLGAQAAVLGATGWIRKERQWLQGFSQRVQTQHGQDCEAGAREILTRAFTHARERVQHYAEQDQINVQEMHSTLLVFLALPLDERTLFIASSQVGDGALYAANASSSHNTALHASWSMLQQQQIRYENNDIRPLLVSTPEEWQERFLCVPDLQAECVLGMTDGIADDFPLFVDHLNHEETKRFLYIDKFYRALQQQALSANDPAVALADLISYRRKGPNDDRTIVCLFNTQRVREGVRRA